MNKVYIVECGEYGEGSTIEGVFSTSEKAEQAAQKYMEKHNFREWKQMATDEWAAGCDILTIGDYEVQ